MNFRETVSPILQEALDSSKEMIANNVVTLDDIGLGNIEPGKFREEEITVEVDDSSAVDPEASFNQPSGTNPDGEVFPPADANGAMGALDVILGDLLDMGSEAVGEEECCKHGHGHHDENHKPCSHVRSQLESVLGGKSFSELYSGSNKSIKLSFKEGDEDSLTTLEDVKAHFMDKKDFEAVANSDFIFDNDYTLVNSDVDRLEFEKGNGEALIFTLNGYGEPEIFENGVLAESSYGAPLNFVPDTRVNASDVLNAVKAELGYDATAATVVSEIDADNNSKYIVSGVEEGLLPKEIQIEVTVLKLKDGAYVPSEIAKEYPLRK